MARRKNSAPNHFDGLAESKSHDGKLYTRIAGIISDALISGRYRPGDRLPGERDLAQHFGVSRPTIREALLALEVHGLLELHKSTGITVTLGGPQEASVSNSDRGALELWQSRRLFEGEVAALAALNATDASVAELARALKNLDSTTCPDAEAPFRAFHIGLAHLSANKVTLSCISELWPVPRLGDRHLHARLNAAASLFPGVWAASHARIFTAILARKPSDARASMNTFSNLAIDHLRQAISANRSKLEVPAIRIERNDARRLS